MALAVNAVYSLLANDEGLLAAESKGLVDAELVCRRPKGSQVAEDLREEVQTVVVVVCIAKRNLPALFLCRPDSVEYLAHLRNGLLVEKITVCCHCGLEGEEDILLAALVEEGLKFVDVQALLVEEDSSVFNALLRELNKEAVAGSLRHLRNTPIPLLGKLHHLVAVVLLQHHGGDCDVVTISHHRNELSSLQVVDHHHRQRPCRLAVADLHHKIALSPPHQHNAVLEVLVVQREVTGVLRPRHHCPRRHRVELLRPIGS
mmetsp:Transcript_13477/g.53516  ORF Transcript_13477/g.53516 Transcript_13477/m.53516 type:complete len:260 (+) Transcript_13477:54-833(+)